MLRCGPPGSCRSTPATTGLDRPDRREIRRGSSTPGGEASMSLLRDLWSTSARRSIAALVLVVLASGSYALAAALTGQVLIHHSRSAFVALSVCLVVSVCGDLAVQLIAARLSSDWTA